MKCFLSVLVLLVSGFSCFSQKAYTVSKDDQTGSQIFKGQLTLTDLRTEPSFKWMKKNEDSYKPEKGAIAYLKQELPAYTIVAIMGTWCDDSQFLIPKLARVLKETKFPMDKFALWGVDREKQTGGIESRSYQVKKVPTIIIYKGNKEIGRIVESAKRSVEVDMIQILQNEQQ